MHFRDSESSNHSTIFYLVRHGETDWNVEKRIQGSIDIPLNPEGMKQAKKFCLEHQNLHFDICFSSDLLRAKETAQILISDRSIDVKIDPRLRERNFRNWEGRSSEEFLENFEREREAVESDEEVSHRMLSCLTEIGQRYPGKKVLVATHGGSIRCLVVKLLNLPNSSFELFAENLAMLTVFYRNGKWSVKSADKMHWKKNKEKLALP